MALTWEELDALIDEALATGPPLMRRADDTGCVDNDGRPRPVPINYDGSGQDNNYRWAPTDISRTGSRPGESEE